MLLSFFLGFLFSLIFLLPLMQQGVTLVGVVFFLSTLIRIYFGFLGFPWYGFSLFLIYVGSLLVMFGYVVSMVPNFFFRQKNFLYVFLVGFFLSLFVRFKFSLLEGVFDTANFIYSDFSFLVFLGLGLVLLLALVCVVKICYFSKSSLRPFSLYV